MKKNKKEKYFEKIDLWFLLISYLSIFIAVPIMIYSSNENYLPGKIIFFTVSVIGGLLYFGIGAYAIICKRLKNKNK